MEECHLAAPGGIAIEKTWANETHIVMAFRQPEANGIVKAGLERDQ